ncbi:MAG: transcription termination/antitermination protein NusG [Candidatus Oxydemutatoraceae bacterium WSBS_2016_MAG_OTU14]
MSEQEKEMDTSTRGWFVIQAYSGFENQVKIILEQRISNAKMENLFHNIMVPCEEVVEMRSGKKRRSMRKLFPGYVLVEMNMSDETWHLVKSVPKVKGFIGGVQNKPTALSEAQVQSILKDIATGREQPKPKVLFETGEVVRVINGPFNDFNAVIEEVSYEKSKLLVSVQIFGRSTPVELDFGQIEKT